MVDVCSDYCDSSDCLDSFDAAAYLYSLQHFGVKLGLSRMSRLMELLGYPCNKFDSIHVAGTNGKGSTCAMLNFVLMSSGKKVGMYTSPHLIDFRERIQVNGEPISEFDLTRIVLEIKKKLDVFDSGIIESGGTDSDLFGEITFFEFTTAVAFVYFSECGVDVAVLEVGLGGRLDATNVVKPIVSVITNIEYDHTKVLGDTREKIAKEKAGVVKKGVPVVCGERNSEIVKLFKDVCNERNTRFVEVDYEYSNIESDLSGQRFNLNGMGYNLALLGRHQIENACIVLKVCEVFNELGICLKSSGIKFEISGNAISAGLKEVKWPGRLQVYQEKPKGSKGPLVIFDGAHNYAGMQKLSLFLKDNKSLLPGFSTQLSCKSYVLSSEEDVGAKGVIIFGVSTGKDVSIMAEYLFEELGHVIITEARHRAQKKEDVAKACDEIFPSYEVLALEKVWDRALELAGKDGMILVCGSLYLVGDLMKMLEERNNDKGTSKDRVKDKFIELKGSNM